MKSPRPSLLRLLFALAAAAVLLAAHRVAAQLNPANLSPEQLKALMMSQPKIDVESPIAPGAVFDPPLVRPGELTTYRVTVNALEASIEFSATPEAPELKLEPRGRGQIMPLVGDKYQPRTTFNFRVKAPGLGSYLVPEYTVTVYGQPVKIPAARLDVTPTVPASMPAAQSLVLKILDQTNIYVGQAVRAQVLLPGAPSGAVQAVAQVQLNGQGFVVDQSSAVQRIERVSDGRGGSFAAYVFETTLTPIAAGKLSLFAQGFAAGNRFAGNIVITGPAVIPGGSPQYTLLDSEPVDLQVRPLPRDGQLPGFAGAIGSFIVDKPVLATNDVRAGEPVRLSVKVHGSGNLARLVPPKPPRLRDWQIFPGPADNLPPQVLQAQGFTTLNYTLIPLNDESKATPEIPFSCFDPVLGRFVDLTIASVAVAVRPANAPGGLVAGFQDLTDKFAEPELALSGLASTPGRGAASLVPFQQQGWFPFVQAAPAVAFAILWLWDRRRRYFASHPEELLRRRARRALHRERRALARAAQRADAVDYLRRAIAALRVASAPHYPAEPRALVGSDVLALLPEPDRHGRSGEVVRAFFNADDARAFSESASVPADLFPLREDFDRVLDLLEEKLRPVRQHGSRRPVAAARAAGLAALVLIIARPAVADLPAELFRTGANAYAAGDYPVAARAFEQASVGHPATGVLQNLGNAEWQRGRAGFAVIAWERALWLDPFNQAARANLRYARKTAQLESPELSWYEVVSTWLPLNWWGWIAGLSFWGAVGVVMLPAMLGWRKTAWHQAAAALGLALFLLSLPAHFGVASRARIGFVLQKATPLRLTPTEEAQAITYLAAGDPARLERVRGKYLLIRTSRATGWLHQDDFALICPRPL